MQITKDQLTELVRDAAAAHAAALAGCAVRIIDTDHLRKRRQKVGVIVAVEGEERDALPAALEEGDLYPCAGCAPTAESLRRTVLRAAERMGKRCRRAIAHALVNCEDGQEVVLWRMWGFEVLMGEDNRLKLSECYAVEVRQKTVVTVGEP